MLPVEGGTDKRDKQRHRKRISVRFGIDQPDKYGFTGDVNYEGLFISSAVVARPGVRLQIELELPTGKVALIGEVRWAKKVPPNLLSKVKGGMGVKIVGFLAGEENYRTLCDELIDRRRC